jgi:hypothetical protein
MKSRPTRARCAASLLALVALSACAAAEAQIPKAEVSESKYEAPSDQALVVFNRPRRRQPSEVTYRVVSQAGRCLAVLNNGWQMSATLWPGRHMLMVVTGTAPPTIQLMELKLSAGKTYVVDLGPRVNVKRPVEIKVLRRKDQPLEAFPSSVRQLAPIKPDLRSCTEWVSWKRAKIETRAEQAKHAWDEGSEEHRDARTVRRGDGWVASEVKEP